MTTAGEAAALFGADDSAADPFSLGALGAEADEAGQDPFAGQELHSATDLFGSASAEDAAFTTQPEAPAEPSYEYTSTDSSWSAPQDTQYTANYSDPSHYASNQSNAYAQQPGSHDYTAQQGQWTGYEPQQYSTSSGNVIRFTCAFGSLILYLSSQWNVHQSFQRSICYVLSIRCPECLCPSCTDQFIVICIIRSGIPRHSRLRPCDSSRNDTSCVRSVQTIAP